MDVIWRPEAREDLASQLAYVRERNPAAAEQLRVKVDAAVARLELFPEMGRLSREIGVRELVIGGTPYIAIYRQLGDRVSILRLFHAAQKRG